MAWCHDLIWLSVIYPKFAPSTLLCCLV